MLEKKRTGPATNGTGSEDQIATQSLTTSVAATNDSSAPDALTDHLPQIHEDADTWWRSTAEQALTDLAAAGRPFTAWDLTDMGVGDPRHPNQWGPLFHWAHRRGLIRPVGYQQSPRRSRSGGACRVWVGAHPLELQEGGR